jgi:hypothetical protein
VPAVSFTAVVQAARGAILAASFSTSVGAADAKAARATKPKEYFILTEDRGYKGNVEVTDILRASWDPSSYTLRSRVHFGSQRVADRPPPERQQEIQGRKLARFVCWGPCDLLDKLLILFESTKLHTRN